jgi:hypothetical protein
VCLLLKEICLLCVHELSSCSPPRLLLRGFVLGSVGASCKASFVVPYTYSLPPALASLVSLSLSPWTCIFYECVGVLLVPAAGFLCGCAFALSLTSISTRGIAQDHLHAAQCSTRFTSSKYKASESPREARRHCRMLKVSKSFGATRGPILSIPYTVWHRS